MIYQRRFKYFFDFVFASLAIVMLLPVIVFIYILVRLDGGPGIFTHKRVGYLGAELKVKKFRTMCIDSENILKKILTDPELKREWETSYRLKDDPRVTRIGNFLRKTKLDELPQFFNVLMGEMSLVGPRPITELEFKNMFSKPSQIKKYQSVKPGITGLWQVSGAMNYEERIELEMHYIDKISLLNDVEIVVKTLRTVYFSIKSYSYKNNLMEKKSKY